jgi:hypothetical protein
VLPPAPRTPCQPPQAPPPARPQYPAAHKPYMQLITERKLLAPYEPCTCRGVCRAGCPCFDRKVGGRSRARGADALWLLAGRRALGTPARWGSGAWPCGPWTPACEAWGPPPRAAPQGYCEKWCACWGLSCGNAFKGCTCKGGCRLARQCQCLNASRECDPDVCQSCRCARARTSTGPAQARTGPHRPQGRRSAALRCSAVCAAAASIGAGACTLPAPKHAAAARQTPPQPCSWRRTLHPRDPWAPPAPAGRLRRRALAASTSAATWASGWGRRCAPAASRRVPQQLGLRGPALGGAPAARQRPRAAAGRRPPGSRGASCGAEGG